LSRGSCEPRQSVPLHRADAAELAAKRSRLIAAFQSRSATLTGAMALGLFGGEIAQCARLLKVSGVETD